MQWIFISLLIGFPMIAQAQGSCDFLFGDGIEVAAFPPVDPSAGCGGGYPGALSLQVNVPGLGNQTYYVSVPIRYQPGRSLPVVLAWHGAAGPGNSPAAAVAVRDLWADISNQHGVLVIAQVSTGSQGGWIPANAELIMDAILTQVETLYNVDRARLFGWGFSAGGHVMHGVALDQADRFAGYGVNAGVLEAYAGIGAPAAASRQIPVSILVGVSDPLQPFAAADRVRFLAAGWVESTNLHYQEFNGGHMVTEFHLETHWSRLRHQVRP